MYSGISIYGFPKIGVFSDTSRRASDNLLEMKARFDTIYRPDLGECYNENFSYRKNLRHQLKTARLELEVFVKEDMVSQAKSIAEDVERNGRVTFSESGHRRVTHSQRHTVVQLKISFEERRAQDGGGYLYEICKIHFWNKRKSYRVHG